MKFGNFSATLMPVFISNREMSSLNASSPRPTNADRKLLLLRARDTWTDKQWGNSDCGKPTFHGGHLSNLIEAVTGINVHLHASRNTYSLAGVETAATTVTQTP